MTFASSRSPAAALLCLPQPGLLQDDACASASFSLAPGGSSIRMGRRARAACMGSMLLSSSAAGRMALITRPESSSCPAAFAAASTSTAMAAQQQRHTHQHTHGGEAHVHREELLPFGTKQGNVLLRYVWDGHSVVPMDPAALEPVPGTSGSGSGATAARLRPHSPMWLLRRWVLRVQDHLMRAFVPSKKDVNDDYFAWLQWRMCSRFLTSTMQNLSTQSMLMALGLGAKRTVAASAAINWLLKDGVGRIARMTVATQFCQSFDSDLKRIRYVTSLIQSVCMSGEFLTPLFPQYFLPLASVSNLGKAIGLCRGSNLADLTAKNQAQHMVVDMLALTVSAALLYLARGSEHSRILMPLLAYPVLAVGDTFATYNELKAIELKTLNRERAEMVAAHWLETGRVPSAYEISHTEHLLLPPDISGGLLPLSITSVDRLITGPQQAQRLLQQYAGEQYVMALQLPRQHSGAATAPSSSSSRSSSKDSSSSGDGSSNSGSSSGGWGSRLPWQPKQVARLHMSLSEDANASDILKAVLEAAHLRLGLRHALEAKLGVTAAQPSPSGRAVKGGTPDPHAVHGSSGGGGGRLMHGDELWARAGALLTEEELEGCVAAARKQARARLPQFVTSLEAQAWKTKVFLLSTTEKVKYVTLSGTGAATGGNRGKGRGK